MTREQIKATVEGLDAISKGVVSGRPDMVARDALTLLQWIADSGDSNADDIVFGVFADLDRERKAVDNAGP